MEFWKSGTGRALSGNPEDSFVSDFSTLPEGTVAEAMLKSFVLVEKENKYTESVDKYFLLTWKIVSADFKGREVTQKIKAFSGSPEQIDRNLNMMKLIMGLFSFSPLHMGVPTDAELARMQGKIAAIKIGEWSLPKNDGSGMMEGNFVREVHPVGSISAEVGVKAVVTSVPTHLDSAFARNKESINLNEDLPF